MRWQIYESHDRKYALASLYCEDAPAYVELWVADYAVRLNFSVILNADTEFDALKGYKSLKF